MSRINLVPRKGTIAKEVAIGIDPYTGTWFAQVFGEPINNEDNLIEEEDVCGRGKLLSIITRWCDKEDPYTEAVYDHIVLDLDPGEVEKEKYLRRDNVCKTEEGCEEGNTEE